MARIRSVICRSLVDLLAWLARYPMLQFWAKPLQTGAPPDPAGVGESHSSRPVNKAIYTYILGEYDLLKEPDVPSAGWRYLCYSDTGQDSTNWEVTPVDREWAQGLTSKQQASLLKIEHYRFTPEGTDLVITIDGSMQIHAQLDDLLEALWEDGVDMVIADHPKRDCVYQEAVAVLEKGFDEPATVCAQMWRYYFEGYPAGAGMYGTRMMIKNNRSAGLRRLCEIWSREYRQGSCRDQLSLNYAVWKTRREGWPLHIKAVDFNWLYKESAMLGIRRHIK